MKNLILLIFLATIPFISLQSQKIIPVKNYFKYGDQYLIKYQINEILIQDEEAYQLFLKSQKQFDSSAVFVIVGGTFITIGTVTLLKSAPNLLSLSEDSKRGIEIGGVLMLTGSLFGTVGLIQYTTAKQNFKKSIQIYNERYDEPQTYEYNINIGLKDLGLNITYSF